MWKYYFFISFPFDSFQQYKEEVLSKKRKTGGSEETDETTDTDEDDNGEILEEKYLDFFKPAGVAQDSES